MSMLAVGLVVGGIIAILMLLAGFQCLWDAKKHEDVKVFNSGANAHKDWR